MIGAPLALEQEASRNRRGQSVSAVAGWLRLCAQSGDTKGRPKSETRRVYNAVLKRYWYHAPWVYAHSIVRGGIDKVHVGLEIEPAG